MFVVPSYVMHEAFDDETVVVNMNRGHYFSFRGPSALLWDMLARGGTEAELSRLSAVSAETLERFCRMLAQEGLIEADPTSGESVTPDEWLVGTQLAGTVERFTDVEGLLLLDPIHDFDQAGWPSARV